MSKEVAKQKVSLKELIKTSEGEIIILQDYKSTKEQLEIIVKKHSDIIVTQDNYKIAKVGWQEIKNLRLSVNNVLKHNKDLLNTAKKDMDASFNELIEVLKPTEDRLSSEIKAIDQAKKEEKIRKENEEKNRVINIQTKLNVYKNEIRVLEQYGDTDEEFIKYNKLRNDLLNDHQEEVFEEFGYEAENLLQQCLEHENIFIDKIKNKKEKIRHEKAVLLENKILARKLYLMEKGFKQDPAGTFYRGEYIVSNEMILNHNEDQFNDIKNEINDIIFEEKRIESIREFKLHQEKKEQLEKEEKLRIEREKKLANEINKVPANDLIHTEKLKTEEIRETVLGVDEINKSACYEIQMLAKKIHKIGLDNTDKLPDSYLSFISEATMFLRQEKIK